MRNSPLVVVALPLVSPFRNCVSDRVSVSIAWSSVRAAKSFEAGSAIAKDAAAAEIDSTAIRLGHFISCSYCQALTDQESNVRRLERRATTKNNENQSVCD